MLHVQVQDSLHGMPRSVGDFFTWGPVVREGPYWRMAEFRNRKYSDLSRLIISQRAPRGGNQTRRVGRHQEGLGD